MIDIKNKFLADQTVIVSTDIDGSGELELNSSGVVSVTEEAAAKLVALPNWEYVDIPTPSQQVDADVFQPQAGKTVFVVSQAYKSGTTKVFINGVLQRFGTDYTESSIQSITLTSAISATDTVTVLYEKR